MGLLGLLPFALFFSFASLLLFFGLMSIFHQSIISTKEKKKPKQNSKIISTMNKN